MKIAKKNWDHQSRYSTQVLFPLEQIPLIAFSLSNIQAGVVESGGEQAAGTSQVWRGEHCDASIV